MPSQQDKAAEWMRSLSERLWSSYHGSAQIQHSVAKGRTRETQVLDIFEGLLPRGVTVGRDVVIVDSTGTEAPSFDGVIYDASLKHTLRIWPQDNDTEGFFVAKIKKT